ncbi:hypothetical protein HN011_007844 [Eciton burchellii]|nr:hypothetical protein HN011_007844 [Eciton burchellii]
MRGLAARPSSMSFESYCDRNDAATTIKVRLLCQTSAIHRTNGVPYGIIGQHNAIRCNELRLVYLIGSRIYFKSYTSTSDQSYVKMFRNIVVGISGGIDSAVTALLLKNKGFNITGIFMKNWDIKDETGTCTVEKDYEDARWVCDKLKIPLVQVDFVKEYWNEVFSDLLEKYQIGYTPNPDVLCNKNIKFDKFFNLARNKFQADAIATGHYARTSFGSYLENYKTDTNVRLLRAHDNNKDQTFFLNQIPQQSLRHCMFPLGDYLKSHVKKIAEEAGLHRITRKKESMGICFVGKREFQDFISEYIQDKPGDFVDLDTGSNMGKHNGIHKLTIGQRCKISGCAKPYFVFSKNQETNTILVAGGTTHPSLFIDFLITKDVYWINEEPRELQHNNVLHCDFRFQHRQPLVACDVYKTSNNRLFIRLSMPLRAITKGQYAVLYSGEECLGGSLISYLGPSCFALNRQNCIVSSRVDRLITMKAIPRKISTNDYDRFRWNILPNYDDYPVVGNCNTEKRMRSSSSFSQFNDDDFFSGGPCPSCRLAINKETGRLKWCTGGSEAWRFRVKLMLLIPAVLLPITIVFIALSRFQTTAKVSDSRTFSTYRMQDQDEQKIEEEIFWPTGRNNVEHTAEEIEDEDRAILSDMKTSYVPADVHPPLRPPQRRKRNIDGENRTSDDFEMDDRVIPSLRAHVPLNNIKSINSSLREESDRKNDTLKRSLSLSDMSYIDKTKVKDGDTMTDNDIQDFDEEVNNFLGDYYPEIEVDDNYESSEAKDYYYSEKKGKGMPFNDKYEEIIVDKRLKGESTRSRDDAFSIFINNTKALLSIIAERDRIDDDEMPDFHTFWKGEGNIRSIREARARIMLKYMDMSVDPCQDFYQYACGNWAKLNPIPKDKAGYDTFEMLRESLDSVLRELLEDPIPSGLDVDDATVKAKHLFQSCMNYEILEQRMEQPLIQLLDELGGWPILRPDWDPDKFDWLLLTAQLRLYNNDILISEWVGPDIKNSDKYVIQFDQTSLGLPTRDYFLQPVNMIYLEAYKDYLIKIAILLGASLNNATVHAEELIEFETQLATITSSSDERRNFSELYQRMSVGELKTLVPQIDWRRYLCIVLARSVNFSEPVVVFALQYMQDLVVLLAKTRPRTVANYLLWRFVRHRVNNLDDRFQEVKQKFYYILFGREQAPSRWKNCVTQVNSNMGMAVGSMFVKKYFDENSKNDTLLMTQEIQRSFRELLNKTTWIDDETKYLATEKVNAMSLKIGYPDFILQPYLLNERYKDILIQSDRYFENTLNILLHLTRVEQDRLGSIVNKTLWNTAPAVVNAYYSRNKNQIMFPAGILQPPFYHRFFPRSLNYGGIGVVIGHEITHGFDDKGRLFDKDGNLHRWWKDEAIEGFHRRAQCLINQYACYTVTEVDMQIDGVNTQGENIADNGGIKQAFRAYERWLRSNEEEDETLPGMSATGKQLFFLNFAQVWCGSMRPEATRNKLKTAVHSPGKFRVIGTLSNSKDFAQVFNCPLGSPMNPVNKCSVW